MKNIISWFEIPVVEMERAKKFYETIFNIKLMVQTMGEATMGFFPCFCDCEEYCECVGGALVKYEGAKPSTDGTYVYFNGGKDLQGILARVEQAGGKITLPKSLINEEIGYYAMFLDTEGNKIALHSRN